MKKTTIVAALAATVVIGASTAAVWSAVGVDSSLLRSKVTLAGVRAHQAALQAVADGNNDSRASGTSGFAASRDYVESKLSTGYFNVTRQQFDFPLFQELSQPVFERVSPNPAPYTWVDDFFTMEYSGSGDVTANLQNAGGIVLPPTPQPSSASGCAATDFATFAPGNIALVQRGTCTFFQKATNAKNAGAAAVIIFNEGQDGRQDAFGGTLGEVVGIPVISASFAAGSALASTNAVVRVKTDTQTTINTTWNVIAETKTGRSDRVVVVGAHLDSVAEGAGINDNGSGTAGILEIARQMAATNIAPRNKVRFMWYGAEEAGLLGSEHYVSTLTATQIKNIAVMLNFDMIGSPNYVRFVYDGDGSDTPDAGPNGSAIIEDVFAKHFRSQGLAIAPTAFDGRSDYGPFIDAGIPAGGLFTGAEDLKTAAEAAIFGGTAGVAHDPCYHAACDTFANNNDTALDQMTDAAADAVLQFAMTTSAVKGTSKANDNAVKSVDADALLYKGSHLQR